MGRIALSQQTDKGVNNGSQTQSSDAEMSFCAVEGAPSTDIRLRELRSFLHTPEISQRPKDMEGCCVYDLGGQMY